MSASSDLLEVPGPRIAARPHRFALGRRGWRVQSGRKNLSHGGLSVLETAVPFIELTKTGSA